MLMQPTDKWYLDGKEVSAREYYRAVYAGTYMDTIHRRVQKTPKLKKMIMWIRAWMAMRTQDKSATAMYLYRASRIFMFTVGTILDQIMTPEGLDWIEYNGTQANWYAGKTEIAANSCTNTKPRQDCLGSKMSQTSMSQRVLFLRVNTKLT